MSKRLKPLTSRLKKGDEVVVIAGDDKGKHSAIEEIVHRPGRIMARVKDVNVVKKHVRPNPNTNEEGGVTLREGLIDI